MKLRRRGARYLASARFTRANTTLPMTLTTKITMDTSAAHSTSICVSKSLMSSASGMWETLARNATAGEAGWIADGKLMAAGPSALEPYRVRRAVSIAAEFGSRLVLITLNTPKPLVRVRGTRIIDALFDAVTAAGIEEIYIVRGYYGDQFDALLYKYPNIKFIENPMYSEANNISSLMAARYLLQGSYVIESDLLLSNPALIKK